MLSFRPGRSATRQSWPEPPARCIAVLGGGIDRPYRYIMCCTCEQKQYLKHYLHHVRQAKRWKWRPFLLGRLSLALILLYPGGPTKPLCADSEGGGPALKPIKSDSCPQATKKRRSRRQLAGPRPSVRRDSNVEAADVARGVPLRPARVGDADSAHVWTCGSPNARARPADRLARRTLRRQGQGTRASASQQVCAAGWHEPQPAARLRRRLARSRSQATRSSAPRGALLLSRPVVVNNLLSHTPQLRSTSFAHAVSGP